MALQKDYASRDYLFGRLLAVADHVEKIALPTNEANRLTNAERYMHQFVNKPGATWMTIKSALLPYSQRIVSKYGRSYMDTYEHLLAEVSNMMQLEDFNSNKKLSHEFLLGFHNQMFWLNEHQPKKGQWVKKVTAEQTTESLEETV